jgi:hypothetical protein
MMMKKKNFTKHGKGHQDSDHEPMKVRENKFFRQDAVEKPVLYRRKCTYITTDTAATGAPFVYAASSVLVQSATDWADLAASFQAFRVRAMKVTVIPVQRDNTNSAALIWYPGTLISGSYPAGTSASTAAALWAEDGSRLHPEWSVASHTVTWETNPDAKLWTNCGTGLPSLSQFGCQFRGASQIAPLAYNNLVTHDVFIEFDVEFLGRN